MGALPPHVATADEAIPDLGQRPWDGPDIQEATPIAEMIDQLQVAADDAELWVMLWLLFAAEAGCSIMVEQDGDEKWLRYGTPCDAQLRHRSRWMHFLFVEMDRQPNGRDLLMKRLVAKGHTYRVRRREVAHA